MRLGFDPTALTHRSEVFRSLHQSLRAARHLLPSHFILRRLHPSSSFLPSSRNRYHSRQLHTIRPSFYTLRNLPPFIWNLSTAFQTPPRSPGPIHSRYPRMTHLLEMLGRSTHHSTHGLNHSEPKEMFLRPSTATSLSTINHVGPTIALGDSTPRVHSTQIQFGSPDGCLEQPLASFNRYQRRGLCTATVPDSGNGTGIHCKMRSTQYMSSSPFPTHQTQQALSPQASSVDFVQFLPESPLACDLCFGRQCLPVEYCNLRLGRHFSSRDESCPPTYHPFQSSSSQVPPKYASYTGTDPFIQSSFQSTTHQANPSYCSLRRNNGSKWHGRNVRNGGRVHRVWMQMEEMSRPKSNHTGMGMMIMRFTPGNTFFVAGTPNVPLWFDGWQPSSTGATFGACFGLFVLTVAVKLLGALRHQAQIAWSMSRWHDSGLVAHNTVDKTDHASPTQTGSLRPTRPAVPWSAQRDVPRGILAALHVGLEYFLMLAIMTYNVYFFVAIVLGHFVGEMAFGRWSTVQGAHC
ncbi:hypothetical protein H4Q26_014873 [Puccinia striiformis f. sp. tritici PST-130]|nr:hypothetical protein H4Q26_014873 [Puccinia striiformis f. sp. tritici PST-130]